MTSHSHSRQERWRRARQRSPRKEFYLRWRKAEHWRQFSVAQSSTGLRPVSNKISLQSQPQTQELSSIGLGTSFAWLLWNPAYLRVSCLWGFWTSQVPYARCWFPSGDWRGRRRGGRSSQSRRLRCARWNLRTWCPCWCSFWSWCSLWFEDIWSATPSFWFWLREGEFVRPCKCTGSRTPSDTCEQ